VVPNRWGRDRKRIALPDVKVCTVLDDESRTVYGAGHDTGSEEGFMRVLRLLGIVGLTLSACSSTDWVHPNKPSSEYINDYNKCQNLVLRDPKLQQGSQLMILNATERCVQKEGWRLVER
jgi:hypothetical protein